LAVAMPLRNTGLGETVGLKTGAVASRLRVTLFEVVPPALVAWQVKVVPVVSVATVWELQPVCMVTVDSLSITDQLRVTVLVYQPFVPKVPVIVEVMTGGVVSGVPMVRV